MCHSLRAQFAQWSCGGIHNYEQEKLWTDCPRPTMTQMAQILAHSTTLSYASIATTAQSSVLVRSHEGYQITKIIASFLPLDINISLTNHN